MPRLLRAHIVLYSLMLVDSYQVNLPLVGHFCSFSSLPRFVWPAKTYGALSRKRGS